MQNIDRTQFAVVDRVKPRPGTELKLAQVEGVVVASERIEGWGWGIKVQRLDDVQPGSWEDSHLFEPA